MKYWPSEGASDARENYITYLLPRASESAGVRPFSKHLHTFKTGPCRVGTTYLPVQRTVLLSAYTLPYLLLSHLNHVYFPLFLDAGLAIVWFLFLCCHSVDTLLFASVFELFI